MLIPPPLPTYTLAPGLPDLGPGQQHALEAALGGLLVAASGLVVFFVARALQELAWVHEVRRSSKHREWALDLRLALLLLFA